MNPLASLAERATNCLAAKGLLPPWGGTTKHHPIFAAFPPHTAPGDGIDIDYLGLRTQAAMLPPYWESPQPNGVPGHPVFDEEYFEWIDLLEAAQLARGAFTMVEFGAGYARWAARAWVAAQRRGVPARVGVVEAEPQHVVWAKSHLAFNAIPEPDITVIEAAVGAEAGETVFLVRMPDGRAGNSPREWYGQAVSWNAPSEAISTPHRYFGHDLVEMPGGWQGVRVAVRPLASILLAFDTIDLADFDIQGGEAAVIRQAIRPLTAKVRRLHIGTHSRAIDAELPTILRPAGWQCLRAFPCLRWNRTEYGWIRFNDGVQTWVNPRFD